MKLYELTEQYRQLQELEALDSESMALAIADTLEAVEGEFDDKAEALIKVTKNIDSDINAIDAEIKRLQRRKDTMEQRKESLRDYLRLNMEQAGITKISCPLFTINCVKGREIAVIDDEDKIPDDYAEEETIRKIDKAALTSALKSHPVPGAHLERSKSAIRIR